MDFSHLSPGDDRLQGDWVLCENQGKESMTWLQGDYVLQARPVTLMDSIKKALGILKPLRDEPEFKSSAGEIVAGEGLLFYTLWPRVRGDRLYFPKSGQFPDWKKLKPLLPELARVLDTLHSLPVDSRAYSVPRNPIVASRMASKEWVLSALEAKIDKKPLLPSEPQCDSVISHGDLALHNMVYQASEVFLFDWSNLSALPRDSDAAHFVQSILSGMEPGAWPEILRQTHCLAAYLSLDDWVAAVLWSLARSAAIWTVYHPWRESFLADDKKISRLLEEF